MIRVTSDRGEFLEVLFRGFHWRRSPEHMRRAADWRSAFPRVDDLTYRGGDRPPRLPLILIRRRGKSPAPARPAEIRA
jgi:hypothetical protein